MENEHHNPYYDPAKLGLEMISLDEPGQDYSFNIFCFWAVEGKVFTANDAGCSCPTPFEDYCGTQKEVLQKLERIGSVEQAETTLDSWSKGYNGQPFISLSEKRAALDWVKDRLVNESQSVY